MNIKGTPCIALALSGGGIRAMVFHLGVLRLLAERNRLENIKKISTVSGGSLIIGLVFSENNLNWPSSKIFLESVYPALRKKLTNGSLMVGIFKQLLKPWNLRYLLSRANLLAMELEKNWGLNQQLSELPSHPEWSINGTTAETGKRFRFKRKNLGDYMIGYAPSDNYPLSNALAVSAAFPGGIGPLSLHIKNMEWKKRPAWDAPIESAKKVDPMFHRIRLYDGGVYDNLGLEPLFDAGKLESKHEGDVIIAVDASSPLKTGFSFFSLNPWRLMRISDIIYDQARSLRVRTFVNYLKKGNCRGSYIYINTPVSENAKSDSSVLASNFPTTLRRINEKEFDLLAEHGYQVTLKTEAEFGLGFIE